MFLNAKRLFLMIGLIFFSFFCIGCSKKNKIVANYIRIFATEDIVEKKSSVINSKGELYEFINEKEASNFEKYNDDFFVDNSLIIFVNYESSSGNKSRIESYKINNDEITINVKTEVYGQTLDIAYYYYVLETNKNDVRMINKININKNGKSVNETLS